MLEPSKYLLRQFIKFSTGACGPPTKKEQGSLMQDRSISIDVFLPVR
jgi:hypothetical protein